MDILADTGEKAIELALPDKPDVVLMDMRLKTSMTRIKSMSTIPLIWPPSRGSYFQGQTILQQTIKSFEFS